MTRPLLMISVALASYAVISTHRLAGGDAGVANGLCSQRAESSAAVRARRLVMLRAFPVATAVLLAGGLIMPAFVIFEPVRAFEAVGPALIALAALGLVLLASGAGHAIISAVATWRIERRWLRSARALDFDPPAGVPAYAVDSFTPVIALVGVFAPKLIAARTVIDACNHHELANIVAHERGHLNARDNLKRWLMACAPDLLRWTPVHHAITLAWDDAAEDAADDAATAGQEVARVDLAALLVKVARLSTGPGLTAATVSPFIERDRLDRRVRRLLVTTSPGPDASQLGCAASRRHRRRGDVADHPEQPGCAAGRARSRRSGRRLRPLGHVRHPWHLGTLSTLGTLSLCPTTAGSNTAASYCRGSMLVRVALLLAVLALPTSAFALKGRVVDQQGRPVANATVSVLGRPGEAITDADGRFEWQPDPTAALRDPRDRRRRAPIRGRC